MSKIRQDRRSQLFLINISSTSIHIPHLNLPLNIVKLLLNFFSNMSFFEKCKGGEVDYEGTLVENKRIEIKPQLRLKLTSGFFKLPFHYDQ
ncbi:hypothetical protein T01_8686 [Trichinella spiralis]|uniref:Uncharacterized protein n=1 Tax=Trichinella spiralis TaxID=6334 RepID=A0A0V1C1N2_TRISP|nr:hypothetical protein T01_8686 [Trichinella spiralis]